MLKLNSEAQFTRLATLLLVVGAALAVEVQVSETS